MEFVSEDTEDEFGVAYNDVIPHIPAVLRKLKELKIPVRFASSVKEIYNKSANNKVGFLEAVAEVNEDIAIKMGLKRTKKFIAEITFVEILPQDVIDDHTGTNHRYHHQDVNIDAPSLDVAKKQAEKMVADMNKKIKKTSKNEYFLDDVYEN
jgi:hypothetical protein